MRESSMRIPVDPRALATFVAGPEFIGARQAITLDERALAIARRSVEDILVEFRDRRSSTTSGNGLVIREADGTPSSTVRLSTRDALQIGITAYLAVVEAINENG